MKSFQFILALIFVSSAFAQQLTTRYEQSGFTETATYDEALAFYQLLDQQSDFINIQEHGTTDIGLPLHLITLDIDGLSDPAEIHAAGRAIFFINNAIHPGEPDGVSASQMFLRELAQKQDQYPVLEKVSLAVIPFYNIGGVLNRNATTRANQNGPKEYGFRGNARHFDLNRDFIKTDTRNARSFQQIFQYLDPDLFLDTHVSNGADYPYVMTLDYTQKDKLGGELGQFLDEVLMPFCYEKMEEKGVPTSPYVNVHGPTPDKGWDQFMDWPRYSSGYAALFHTIGFMSETHMLKSYQQRVEGTYAFMHTLLEFLDENGDDLLRNRAKAKERIATAEEFEISWKADKNNPTMLDFRGYTAEYPVSRISGKPRLKYNQDKPWTKTIPYYDNWEADIIVKAPTAYIIPQQWSEVIDLLKNNGVEVETMIEDKELEVEYYMIDDYQTLKNPYEGHYKHYDVTTSAKVGSIKFRKGDAIVNLNQWRNRFVVECLEPSAPDSYFAWNFFDAILQQKEYFSPYIFEETAEELLMKDDELKQSFEQKKAADSAFAENAMWQLYYIYQRSPHREPEYLRYPVFRLME
ncbi:MAG: hypothetical protein JXQ90_05235 [Cyclobacteriaceae bacterium]